MTFYLFRIQMFLLVIVC